jgi:hypothetical protein
VRLDYFACTLVNRARLLNSRFECIQSGL